MPSSKPPKPSSDVDNSSGAERRAPPLLAAGVMLAGRGTYGMVWVSPTLEVTARYGQLVDFIEIGEQITDELMPLVGLENDIRALMDTPGRILEMPGVAIARNTGMSPKINISIYWSADEQCFLVVLTRLSSRSDVEVELSRQVRARLIAEAEVSQKSREMAKANAELERANRDLEEFASIISHDLKAPMRHLRYIVDDLETAIGGSVSEGVAEKLSEIRRQSHRMSKMLTALLEYSSAGRKEEIAEEVDTRALVHSITQSVQRPRGLSIEVTGDWPRIVTLSAPLDLVLRNLIDNAIKHHDRDEGTVVLDCADEGAALLITVVDDGPGIPPDQHAAAFMPFRRLGTGGAEGKGMGLALVNRWVEAAGARIELDSNPTVRRGSTFRLTWPGFGRD